MLLKTRVLHCQGFQLQKLLIVALKLVANKTVASNLKRVALNVFHKQSIKTGTTFVNVLYHTSTVNTCKNNVVLVAHFLPLLRYLEVVGRLHLLQINSDTPATAVSSNQSTLNSKRKFSLNFFPSPYIQRNVSPLTWIYLFCTFFACKSLLHKP